MHLDEHLAQGWHRHHQVWQIKKSTNYLGEGLKKMLPLSIASHLRLRQLLAVVVVATSIDFRSWLNSLLLARLRNLVMLLAFRLYLLPLLARSMCQLMVVQNRITRS